ncbi:hypothetical protein L218DRAFT_993726 [Marasmius fiardii PR-910]|nr:hypothetical protein L218DRAFT_993726 [Marasmius fiardii PR-910]
MPLPNRDRLVEDCEARMRPGLYHMLDSITRELTHGLIQEKGQLLAQLSNLEAQLASYQNQLQSTKSMLENANSKAIDLDMKLREASMKAEELDNKLQDSERRNCEIRREYEQAKKRWTGVIRHGYREMKAERDKALRKQEKMEDELTTLQMKAKAARRLTKKATFVLKDDDLIRCPRSHSGGKTVLLRIRLNGLADTLTHDLTAEKAQLETQVQALQARLESLQTQLNDAKLELAEANSKVADMDVKLLEAHTKLDDINDRFRDSESRNDAMKRELETAKIRWTGVVTTGWSEAETEREKLRRKLEKKEEELALVKLKTKTARRWMKKATFILKDDVLQRPGSRSSASSSESSYDLQHHKRRK